MLTLIAARDRNGVIGRDGTIPWHLPEDLAIFQRETLGGAVIMGRRTWHSLPRQPLPRRLNLVVTSQPLAEASQARACASVEDALSVARSEGWFRIYGIGGEGIYRALLPLAERAVLTELDLAVEGGDTRFPDLPPEEWRTRQRWPLNSTDILAQVVEYRRR